MYLKRLDVIGFKSFAERVAVEFVPGVTAVVGPNGSGKSNITDAVRWVLGEQSAKSLRGAKMEDIIFAGSDSRKALNFAEVTLTLDNEDQALPLEYNEVSVTRRVYRSGDSEYLINGRTCRLKDIIDLFMDSGLGREAFSIISQGKVEEILNSKPEDRRTIFEEAAGVLKYKTRKKKAESKLLETQENLNRVSDILHELESQVEPLKMQASIARDYLAQKEELERIEVALTAYEIEELHERWKALSDELEDNRKKELAMSSELQKKEAEIEQYRDQLTALDESVSNLQNVLLATSEELEKLEGRKEVLKERKKNASQNREQLEKNILEITGKTKILQADAKSQENTLQLLERETRKLEESLRKKLEEHKLYSEDIESKIDSLKSEYIDLLNRQASARNELALIDRQLGQDDAKSARLKEENAKFLESREDIGNKKEALTAKLHKTSKELAVQASRYRDGQEKLQKLKLRCEEQENTLYKAYQFLQQTKSRKEALEDMQEDYSGFFQGVKEVLKARGKKLDGIEGAIAELVKVPKEMETALETALAGAMQHIVVEKEENARAAIAYLKKESFGRATFLPLSVIRGKAIASSMLMTIASHPSYIGCAADLIEYDHRYENIMKNLLGNVVIAKDLKGANEIARLLQYRSRVVTLDGDVVNPGGSMSGGAVKQKSSSLLSRKSELEELKAKLSDMESKTAVLENSVKKTKAALSEMEESLDAMRKAGEMLRMEEQEAKSGLREVEIEERNINDRLAVYDSEKKQVDQDRKSQHARKESLKSELEKVSEEISRLDKEINRLTERKNTNSASKETTAAEISELKIGLTAKREQLHALSEKHDYTLAELDNHQSKLDSMTEDLNFLRLEMQDSFSGENTLEEAAKNKLRDKNNTIELIAERRKERVALQSKLEESEIEGKELKRQYRGMTEILKDEEVKINRLEVELDNRIAHLREEYLLSYEAAREQYPLQIPPDDARRKVRLIKLAIEELGPVNLGAIDEYERISGRYEFLLGQREDLQEAKDTLFTVIGEMDEEMRSRFSHTFKEIRSHFDPVFRSLFGGGRADLKLTNPDDLLNTGVELVAQPPGKKLQNLGLLSGGERALTAIALLFSILKVRPVPFCILDEVEAALDEANVSRFSQYLKGYSGETQFIVITHRKGTMEGADVLYGVTMQESGVSKVVSVRLEETKELVKN
ncbi:chromosome segregation protein SMC [Bacillus massilinigeriensis]|uniref:chromosome segregation protein SMC n=1 Tax=Bacillus mediterraneensis TaxID=1805474 RepID=UPI0008F82342|nr:chromosome segregation protein SMC [Bacillus mediterraneensis]